MKSDPNKNKMLSKEEKEIPFEYAVMYNCSGGGWEGTPGTCEGFF